MVHISGIEPLRLILQPVVQLMRTHGKVPGGIPRIHFLPGVGQLPRLVDRQKRITDGARPAAQVLPVRLRQHFGHREGDSAHTQAQHRAVRDLRHHIPGDLDVHRGGLLISAQGKGLMDALYDIIGLRQMHPVGAVHPLEPGKALIDLKDHRAGVLKNGAPGIVGDAQSAVPLPVRPGDGHKGHIHPDMAAVQLRQGPEHHGQELHQPPALQLALIVPDVPAVIGEGGLLRVALHHLDPGPDHQSAADLHVLQLLLPGGKGPVHQLREARAKAVVHPVAGADRLGGRLRGHKSVPVIVHPVLLAFLFQICHCGYHITNRLELSIA